jgi:AcrR family transcriptional regulator
MGPRSVRRKLEPKRAIQTYARTAYTEAILEAAEKLFQRVGYHEAKMADVAQAAGVSVGTLYKYFPGKIDVFTSILQRGRDESLALMDECFQRPEPMARLTGIVESLFAQVEKRGSTFALVTELGPMPELQVWRKDDDCVFESFISRLEAAIKDAQKIGKLRKDVDARTIAITFEGAMRGTMFTWLRGGREYSLVERAKPLFDLFLEGARAR